MTSAKRHLVRIAFGAALFLAGIIAGDWHARGVAAQNRFGQPRTVLHVVVYKWKPAVSEGDQQKTIDGIKTLAAKIPGIKNIWLKTQRNQTRDFSGVYTISLPHPHAPAHHPKTKPPQT